MMYHTTEEWHATNGGLDNSAQLNRQRGGLIRSWPASMINHQAPPRFSALQHWIKLHALNAAAHELESLEQCEKA